MDRVRLLLEQLLSIRRRWLGLMSGVVVWLSWMIFGIWSTLLLVILSAIGFVVGRVLEERQSWKEIVEKLLTDRYRD